jgi:hypothetical protein
MNLDRRFTLALLILAIVKSIGHASETPDEARIAKAIEEVVNVLEGWPPPNFDVQLFEDERLTGKARYDSLGFQRAYDALWNGKVSDFVQPMPFVAWISENDDRQVRIVVKWLSSVDNVGGLQVLNSCGNVVAKGKIEQDYFEDQLTQFGVAAICFVGDPDGRSELTIDPRLLLKSPGSLQVRFLGKNGPIGKPVGIWILDEVCARAKAAIESKRAIQDPARK